MNRDEGFSSIISEQADRQFRELGERQDLAAMSAGQWQAGLWHAVEESALSLALVPEAQGGVGIDAADAFEIVRLSGYRGLPLPLGDTMVAKALWCEAGGDIEALGDGPVLLVASRDGLPFSLRRSADGMRLHGRSSAVAFGDVPEALLLLAARGDDGEDFLLILDAGTPQRTALASPALETACSFRFQDLPVPAERSRPWNRGLALALQAHGAFLRSMQMVGAMQRCVELGLQYAADRVQFGRPIARFAPVQDMLVEAGGETAAAIGSAGLGLERWQPRPTPTSVFCIAGAKSRCGEAAGKVSALVHQVHGAIGFTQEHALHRFTRRLWAWRDDFGSESFWNRWIGEQVCASPGDELWQRICGL